MRCSSWGNSEPYERPIDVRATIERGERQPDRKPEQHRDRARPGQRRQPGIRDRLGQADVEVEAQGRGDFVLKELSQAAMTRIDPAQQLAFVVAEADRVIGLPRAGLPHRFLAGQHHRQTIEVGDQAPVHRLIEGEQARLVSQELADGDGLFSLLGKLRPVAADALLVVEPAPGMGDRQGHRGQALGSRVDQDHRVLLPGLTGRLVPDTAPQVDDLLTSMVHATSAAQFVSPGEVLGERICARPQSPRSHAPSIRMRCDASMGGAPPSGQAWRALSHLLGSIINPHRSR